MSQNKLTKELFRTLKAGDIISNKHDFKGGPTGYDYLVVEGYQRIDKRSKISQPLQGQGCIKISLLFGIDNKYIGEPYYLYESEIDDCLGLYKKL